MNFTYENHGTTTFLVYAACENETIDSVSLGMITNNKIPGIAGTVVTQLNTQKYIKYNVSARVSVQQFFSGPVNKKRLLGVFAGITDAMLSAEEYMIDPNMLLMDLNYIFADVSTCETVLICLPILNESESRTNLGAFFKQIMFTTQFDPTENCDHVAKIINYLNSTPIFSLSDFKELLNGLLNESAPHSSLPAAQPTAQPKVQAPLQEAVQPKAAAVVPPPVAPSPVLPQPPVAKRTSAPKPAGSVPAVPLKPLQAAPPKAVQQQPKQEPKEKISLFYLLQHYNSENAAAYKAQKEERKKKKAQPAQAASFTVPGASQLPAAPGQTPAGVNPGFAIPGQPAPPPTPAAPPAPCPAPAPQPVAAAPSAAPQSQFMNFGETTVLNGGSIGETTVLNSTQAAAARVLTPLLIRIQNNERIAVNKPVFRIGKERSYVDYFIADNTAVSRSHATIITRNGQYFILDTNSTNHTYVNGVMIQSNVEVKLASGDMIVLGNEEFEFKLS